MESILSACLFLAIFFHISEAEVHLPFSTRTAQQKRTIKVRCRVTGEDFVAWEMPSRVGDPAQWLNVTSPKSATGRVRLQIEDNKYNINLVIEDVSVGDGGVYTCKGSNHSRNFTLEVDFVSHGVKSPQILRSGENGSIELDISAFPKPKYVWSLNGIELPLFLTGRRFIDPYTGSLRITNVSRIDAGNYTCTVRWKSDTAHETEDTVEIEVFVAVSGTSTAGPQLARSIAPSVLTSTRAITGTAMLNQSSTFIQTSTFEFRRPISHSYQTNTSRSSPVVKSNGSNSAGSEMNALKTSPWSLSGSVVVETSQIFSDVSSYDYATELPSESTFVLSVSQLSTAQLVMESSSFDDAIIASSSGYSSASTSSSIDSFTSFEASVSVMNNSETKRSMTIPFTHASAKFTRLTPSAIMTSVQLVNDSNVSSSTPGLFLSAEFQSQNQTVSVTTTSADSMLLPASSLAMVTTVAPISQDFASPSLMAPYNGTSHSSVSSERTFSSRTMGLSQGIPTPSSPSYTSADDGLVVMSYSTPCYIYFVVQKTVLPVLSANHSLTTLSTPKVALDVGSITSLLPKFPSVTLTRTASMTTQPPGIHSQSHVSFDATGFFSKSAGESLISRVEETTTVTLIRSFVATHSFLEKHDLSTVKASFASTRKSTAGATYMASSIAPTSSFQSREFNPTVASPMSFPSLGSRGRTSSVVSQVMSRSVVQSTKELVLQTGPASSSSNQVLFAVTSSTLSNHSSNSNATRSLESSGSKTSTLSMLPSVTIQTPSRKMSSTDFNTTSLLNGNVNSTINRTPSAISTVEAAKSSSTFSFHENRLSGSIQLSSDSNNSTVSHASTFLQSSSSSSNQEPTLYSMLPSVTYTPELPSASGSFSDLSLSRSMAISASMAASDSGPSSFSISPSSSSTQALLTSETLSASPASLNMSSTDQPSVMMSASSSMLIKNSSFTTLTSSLSSSTSTKQSMVPAFSDSVIKNSSSIALMTSMVNQNSKSSVNLTTSVFSKRIFPSSTVSEQKMRSAGVPTYSLSNETVSPPLVSSRHSMALSTISGSSKVTDLTLPVSMTTSTSQEAVNSVSFLSISSNLSTSSVVFRNTSERGSSTLVMLSQTPSTHKTPASSVVVTPSVLLQSGTTTLATDLKESSVAFVDSLHQTQNVRSSSLVASSTFGSVPSSFPEYSVLTSKFKSTKVQQTLSSLPLMQRSALAIQSSLPQTSSMSLMKSSTSPFVYRPPLMTMSSLGICYVIYTTRLIQPVPSPTPQVTVNFTRIANASFVHVLPSKSLNFTSSDLRLPTVTTSASTVASSEASYMSVISVSSSASVLLAASSLEMSSMRSVAVNTTTTSGFTTNVFAINSTVASSEASYMSVISVSSSASVLLAASSLEMSRTASVTPAVSSTIKMSTASVSLSASSFENSITSSFTIAASSLEISAAASTFVTTLLSSPQVRTSQVSSTRAFSPAVSSSMSVHLTTSPPASSLLQTTLIVPLETDIQLEKFKRDLGDKLVTAYKLAERTSKRRRRNAGEVTANVHSIERLANASHVNATFYVTKNGEIVPANQASQTFNRLNKNMLTVILELEVVTMPQPLNQVPTTPPPSEEYLVFLIIQNSGANNVSIPANKERLEFRLASYYKEKQQNQSITVTATIFNIVHEPKERAFLAFFISENGKKVNRTVVVDAFKVHNVNLLTAKLGVQALSQVYIPESLGATESDHVIIGLNIDVSQDLKDASFRGELANKLAALYVEAKGRTTARRRKRSGSSSTVSIVDIVRRNDSQAPEADVTFYVFDSGLVVNGSYVASVLNRLSTGQMTTFTTPYAVLTAPRRVVFPTTEPPPFVSTVAPTPIPYWIIGAVLGSIFFIMLIAGLLYWRWKKGAPKAKVEPDTIRMLETNRNPPVRGVDVVRHSEPGVSSMKTTAFMSSRDDEGEEEEKTEKPVKQRRETSLRRKVAKPPIQSLPTTSVPFKRSNRGYVEEEEEPEITDSGGSVTPTGSTEVLIRSRSTPRSLPVDTKPPAAPQRTQEPQRRQELSDDESEEESEISGEETEAGSVAPPSQAKHSAAQLPTVAVMSEASGPPRYPPVRFRSSVHPASSLPPLNPKQASLVGVRVESPSDGETRRMKARVTKQELDQKSDLERQRNKQRLRDRKRDSLRGAVPSDRRAWDRAQHDFDDVLADGEFAERVITGRKVKRRKRRPQSGSVAADEEGMPQLKSYRKLKSPKTISSAASSRDDGKKANKSTESASNVSSEESEIDMNETRRRMHAMLDDAFSLFGPQSAHKPSMQYAEQSPQLEGYPGPPARHAVIPRYVGGHPALPEPPPAHGRATEPTPGQRRRIRPTMPGYPTTIPQTPIGVPGYPGRLPVNPVVTRDPLVVWDPAERQRILDRRAPPQTYAYRDPSGQNVYITPVQQQRDDMAGGLVWSPYNAEDTMDSLYPDLAQASYPGALGTSPPKDSSYLSQVQSAEPHDTVLNMSTSGSGYNPKASLGQSPQPLIKSIKGELFRLSQGTSRKTPITEL
ncbi:serine-rich adhesin for platelets-like isoform X2 [Acropora muricata]|uniref:serine-rich adhesin for platelets-like isoform X2 n=1 Tax=Acropora muricata TaxID=159855 RepID=UPI0034E5FD7D